MLIYIVQLLCGSVPYGKCLCCIVDGSVGSGKGQKLKVMVAATESAEPTARESIFHTMLSGPRPIVSILILWTDLAQRRLAFILRRLLHEGFQVVGLKLHVNSTAAKYSSRSNMVICIASLTLLLGEEASLSIGNTLWCISTMFMHPAITLPEMNGFG